MSESSSGPVTVDGVGSGLWAVTLNRPTSRNAIDEEMQVAILDVVHSAAADPDVRAIVLTGSGPAFSAGGDFGLIRRMQDDPEARRGVLDQSRSLFGAMRDLHVPVVAAVNGPAIGAGCTLVLLCDIVIMAEEASLGDPRVVFGLAPGDGAAVLWPLLGGLPAARSYLLTGERITANEAFRIGLISRTTSADELMETALTVATKLASLPPGAVQSTKRALNRYVAVAEAPVFEFALAAESASLDTAEHKEAVQRLAKPSQKARREAGNETSEKK